MNCCMTRYEEISIIDVCYECALLLTLRSSNDFEKKKTGILGIKAIKLYLIISISSLVDIDSWNA